MPWQGREFYTEDIVRSLANTSHEALCKVELVSSTHYDDELVEFIENMRGTKLGHLNLVGAAIDANDFQYLLKITTLVQFDFDEVSLTGIGREDLDIISALQARQGPICVTIIKKNDPKGICGTYIRRNNGHVQYYPAKK